MFLNCASFHVIEIKELSFEKGVFIDMVASLENLTQNLIMKTISEFHKLVIK